MWEYAGGQEGSAELWVAEERLRTWGRRGGKHTERFPKRYVGRCKVRAVSGDRSNKCQV